MGVAIYHGGLYDQWLSQRPGTLPMPPTTPVPVEEELIRSFGLTVFEGGGDLHLTADGDLGLTRDGDLSVGDVAFNAMCRLLGAWRYNVPTMRLLFDTIAGIRAARPGLEQDLERAHRLDPPWEFRRTPEQLAAYHAASEALDAGEIGCATLSGSLVLVVANFLGRFKADVGASAAEWRGAAPQVRGYSVGQIVLAAANAFRHADEWAAASHAVARGAGTFTGQQRGSMDVLHDALNPDPASIPERPEWEAALDTLSGGSFDGMTGSVLRFANDVALKVRVRLAQPT